MENYVLGRLGLCIDPRRAEAAGIPGKALRAVGIGSSSELSEREKKIRAKLRRQVVQESRAYSDAEGREGLLPGFGPHEGFASEGQIALSVNAEKLTDVCRKIIRGLEYHEADRYVESPYELRVYFIKADAAEEIATFVGFGSPDGYWGPGFKVQRRTAQDDPKHVIYRIKIWGTLLVHGAIFIPG